MRKGDGSSELRRSNKGHLHQHRESKSMERCLEELFLKKGSARENALSLLVDGLRNKLQHEFLKNKCITLLHRCLNSIKIGSSKEIHLASQIIGLLSLTAGSRDSVAHEILEDSFSPLSQALKPGSEALKISSLLDCLAIITFVGGTDPTEIERSMQVMWQLIHSKSSSNVIANKSTPQLLTAGISAWTFLLASMYGWNINAKIWKESLSFFSYLLDDDERSVCIAACEALVLIFEIGTLEKFSNVGKGSNDSSISEGANSQEENVHIQELKGKILNQMRNLSIEVGGKSSIQKDSSIKKDLSSQQNLILDVLGFLEDDFCLKTSIKIGGDVLNISTWSQLIQVKFLKHFLQGGFAKHMQENELLHDFFEFAPKRKQQMPDDEQHILGSEKVAIHYVYQPELVKSKASQRMFKSPNYVVNKAKSKLLNKERALSQARNAGHYAVSFQDEEA